MDIITPKTEPNPSDFNVGEATQLVTIIFARMNKGQRLSIIKLLKMARPKLDLMYPMGMQPEKKATDSLILPK